MFPTSSVGKKFVMAATGQFMVVYVVLHVLGNSTIFAHAINAYADGLRHWPYIVILWTSRILLFISILLHAWEGIVLKLENRKAKPNSNIVTTHLASTFAGRTAIWSGLVIAAFLIYHLLHFTLQVIEPSIAAITHPDTSGRPDVFGMVTRAFGNVGIAVIYMTGVLSLGLHLWHGIQSSFQTWGMNGERTFPMIIRIGAAVAALLFLGYAAIPMSVVMGILKP